MMPEIGKTIGQYTLLEQIGTGGMATVYRAKQSKLDRDVAVKIMHQTFLSDAAFTARFEREARIVAQLDHPNIVPIYDYDQVNGVPYLVMKHISGKTLKRRLNENGALSLDEIIKVTDAIGGALSYAHGRGILHRDIKPSNIILDEQGTPYLMDFGLARIAQVGESTMSADMMIGTPYYISPEQAQGEKSIDHRADVYSLGVVLYELVVGQPPFTGETPFIIVHKHIFNAPTPPSQINPDIPPEVDAVILKALAKSSADRYESAAELARAFKDAVRQSGLAALNRDRAAAAAQYKRDHPSPVPENIQAGRHFTTIPSPYESDPMTRSSAIAIADDVMSRIRDTVFDIRTQVQDRGFSSRVREKVVSVTEQLENAADRPGISRALRFNRIGQIERDFGMREDLVRVRVEKQIEERRGFIGHVITFLIVGGLLFVGGQTILPTILREAFTQDNELYLMPLAQINLAWAALLPWFGALVAHGIGTFSKTGRRAHRLRDKIDHAMTARYGEDWVDTATDRQYRTMRSAIKQRFTATYDFFQTFAVLGSIWLLSLISWPFFTELLPEIMRAENDLEALAALQNMPPLPLILGFAFMIPLFILAARALLTPFTGASAREREIDREMARRHGSKRKLKNDSWQGSAPEQDLRLTGDGELTDSFVEEMQQQRRTRK